MNTSPNSNTSPKKYRKNVFDRTPFSGGSALENMILALSDEIDFSDKNTTKQRLKNGEFIHELGGLYLYEFPLLSAFDFEPDEDVSVAINGNDYRGKITQVDLGKVVIAIDKDQGRIIAHVDISKAENALEKLLRSQLVKVHKGESILNKTQADLAIGIGKPSVSNRSIPGVIDSYLTSAGKGFSLNPGQEEFISKGQASSLTLLWGPPGCGKTMCIGLLASIFLSEQKRVLLVSNTNKAVDGALNEVLETQNVIGDESTKSDIVRLGGQNITDEFRRDWPNHLLESIVDERSTELSAETSELEDEKEQLSGVLAQLSNQVDDYNELEESRARLPVLDTEIKEARESLQALEAELASLNEELQNIETEWMDAPEDPSLVDRISGRRSKQIIEEDRQGKIARLETAKSEQLYLEDKISEELQQKRLLNDRISDLMPLVSNYPPLAKLKADLDQNHLRLRAVNDRLSEIRKILDELSREIITNAGLVGTTVHKTFIDPILSSVNFDVVIIDEASMVVLPMVYWAAGRSTAQVVIVGDFRQLPAIVKDNESTLVAEWMGISTFHKWNIPKKLSNSQLSDLPHLVMLQEQNRMHPKIGGVVSELFYNDIRGRSGHGLLPGPRAKMRVTDTSSILGQTTDKRILLIDTKDIGGWSSQPFGGSGRFNPTHVALGLAILDRLIEDSVLIKGQKEQFGIVTPYSGQANLYADSLQGDHREYCDTTSVGTAHRFQGGERDIMLFDFVLSESRKRHNRFIDSETGEDQPGNLINVAISRAKKNLIILYNSTEFNDTKKTHPWMIDFFKKLETNGEHLNAIDLLNKSLLTKVLEYTDKSLLTPNSDATDAFNEIEFYDNITHDLRAAKSSVFIFSAFATPRGVTRWMDTFSGLLRKGVKIRLLTKPISEQPKPKTNHPQLRDIFGKIRKSGITLDNRTATHEKVILIDEEIVWLGSLNMLSHDRDRTTEIMTRTVSHQYASNIIKILARHDLKQTDPFKSQIPVCPTCGESSDLITSYRGWTYLSCSQDCGFITGQQNFHRIAKGLALGRRLSGCPSCSDGTLFADIDRNGLYARCTNHKNKKGPKCDYKEELNQEKLGEYDPFPPPKEPNPNLLDSIQENTTLPSQLPLSEKNKSNKIIKNKQTHKNTKNKIISKGKKTSSKTKISTNKNMKKKTKQSLMDDINSL